MREITRVRPTPDELKMKKPSIPSAPSTGAPEQPKAPGYEAVVHRAATALANRIAEDNGVPRAQNMLDLVDTKTREQCLATARIIVDELARMKTDVDAGKTPNGQLPFPQRAKMETKQATCEICQAGAKTGEYSDVTKVLHLTLQCGAETLVFLDTGRKTVRRECRMAPPVDATTAEVPNA